MKVWAIYYKLKMDGVWSKDWTGPCGIFFIGNGVPVLNNLSLHDAVNICDILRGRPFFFRTKKQALEVIAQLNKSENKKWTRHKAIPMELSWKAKNSLTR